VRALQIEELGGYNNALVIYFVVIVLEISAVKDRVPTSDLKTVAIDAVLKLPGSLLFEDLARFFVNLPMLDPMLVGTIFGTSAVSADENSLTFTNLAAF
jgi:hypothetical protein